MAKQKYAVSSVDGGGRYIDESPSLAPSTARFQLTCVPPDLDLSSHGSRPYVTRCAHLFASCAPKPLLASPRPQPTRPCQHHNVCEQVPARYHGLPHPTTTDNRVSHVNTGYQGPTQATTGLSPGVIAGSTKLSPVVSID